MGSAAAPPARIVAQRRSFAIAGDGLLAVGRWQLVSPRPKANGQPPSAKMLGIASSAIIKAPTMKRIVLFLVLLAAPAAFCEGTQVWKQSSYDEFAKGTAKGVAMRSDGTIELAPSFRQLYVTPSTYIWAIAADREGNVFAAAGSPSRVYRVTLSGQATVVFQPQELQ